MPAKRNPFRIFEKTMKMIGTVIASVFIGFVLIVGLVVLPIYGILEGDPWHGFFFWFFLLGVIVLSVIGVLLGNFWDNVITPWWYSKKYQWDKDHKDYQGPSDHGSYHTGDTW